MSFHRSKSILKQSNRKAMNRNWGTKPIGISSIITRLIRTVNHFTGKFILSSNSQLDQLLGIGGYWRAAGGVDTLLSTEIMRLGT